MVARTAVFVDTAYLLALLNTRDRWHPAAVRWEQMFAAQRRSLVTTEFLLLEVADALSKATQRQRAILVIDSLNHSSFVQILPASEALVARGLELYRARPDKDWGLTDCTSFVVMQEHGLSEALTSDDHFRQAGYRVLLDAEPA